MRLTPELRRALVQAVKRGLNINLVAKAFNVSRVTVWKWCKRAYHRGKEYFRDKVRRAKREKITVEVELAILGMRTMFKWGTARIQQGLMSLPKFMRDVFEDIVQGVRLSRTSINKVLIKHKLNGYRNKFTSWKFFRARKPNELWQLDIKGPFRVQSKKYWFLICVDDYSRYIVLAEQYEHDLKIEDIEERILSLIKKHKPKKILTDNKPFGKSWKRWCKEQGVEALFAHPYYPQDKGKVERTIRNLAEEFVNLLVKFPQWLKGKLEEWRRWYNKKRFNRGINDYPHNLYMLS